MAVVGVGRLVVDADPAGAGDVLGAEETTRTQAELVTLAAASDLGITTWKFSLDVADLTAEEATNKMWADKVAAGAASINDWRKAMGLPAVDGGDVLNKSVGGGKIVMVGFNRRFSPLVQKMKGLLKGATGPKAFVMTINAGAIAATHWTQDMGIGGGRIIGEGCHFIDLLRFLAASPISSYTVTHMDAPTADTVTISFNMSSR